MAVALSKLSLAERIMFGVALLIAGIVVALRLGTVFYLHHAR
jgi:hypothetical protein